MTRILFVCRGNICRSPMAEYIFRTLTDEKGVTDRFPAASCATGDEEIVCGKGNPVYPPARAELARHGISCEGKRARCLSAQDYRDYDLLIGMDSANIRNMQRICNGDPERKMHRLLEYAGRQEDVADPWYTRRFDSAFTDIEEGCRALLGFLTDSATK